MTQSTHPSFPLLFETANMMSCSGGNFVVSLAEFDDALKNYTHQALNSAEQFLAGLTLEQREYVACPYDDGNEVFGGLIFAIAFDNPANAPLSRIYNGEEL